jgi:hypothetical protein
LLVLGPHFGATGQLAVVAEGGQVEVPASIQLIGVPAVDELLHLRDDLLDVVVCAGVDVHAVVV